MVFQYLKFHLGIPKNCLIKQMSYYAVSYYPVSYHPVSYYPGGPVLLCDNDGAPSIVVPSEGRDILHIAQTSSKIWVGRGRYDLRYLSPLRCPLWASCPLCDTLVPAAHLVGPTNEVGPQIDSNQKSYIFPQFRTLIVWPTLESPHQPNAPYEKQFRTQSLEATVRVKDRLRVNFGTLFWDLHWLRVPKFHGCVLSSRRVDLLRFWGTPYWYQFVYPNHNHGK